MHNSLKIIKSLLYSYSALHVSGTLAPIIRSLLILHIQPPVTVCRWVGCIIQFWSVTTVACVCLWGGIPPHEFPDLPTFPTQVMALTKSSVNSYAPCITVAIRTMRANIEIFKGSGHHKYLPEPLLISTRIS
jgi:hypothetical protein